MPKTNQRTARGQQERRHDLGFCRDSRGRFDTCEGGVGGSEHTAALDFFNEWEDEKIACRDASGRMVKKGSPGAKSCTRRRPYTARDWPWGDEAAPGGKPARPTWKNKKAMEKRIAAWLKKNPGKEAVDYTGRILRPSQLSEILARRGRETWGGIVPPLDRLMKVKKGDGLDYYVRKAATNKAKRAAGVAKGVKTRAKNAPKKVVVWSFRKGGPNKDGTYTLVRGKKTQAIKPVALSKKGKNKGKIAAGKFKGKTLYQRARAMMEAKNAKLKGGSANWRSNSCSCW